MFNLKTSTIVLGLLLCCHCLSAQEQPYKLLRNVRIIMRDSVSLGANVVMPKGMDRGPVILIVNCYPTEQDPVGMYRVISQCGFILVDVHNRGKGLSDGVFEPFVNDTRDNYDVISWIARQSWCNGNIGMGGGSYLGFAQWAAAKNLHPALKGIAPMVSAAPGIDFPALNGVFMSYTLRWLNYTTNLKYTDKENFADHRHWYLLYNRMYKQGRSFRSLDSLDQNKKTFFQKALDHPSFDDFWKEMLPYRPEEYNKIDIPVLTITGYFDDGQRGAIYYYNMHNKYGKPEAVKNHYLFIGPYTHFGAQSIPSATVEGYKIDSAAIVNIHMLNLAWFDHVLNGKPRPELLKDRVNCFVLGDGWRSAPSLQEIAKDTTVFYLHSGNNTFHSLANTSGKSRSLNIDFNPMDVSDSIDMQKTPANLFDDESLPTEDYASRTQQLVFQSAPLEEDLDLIGSPVADLFLKFKKLKDCDLLVEWYEVSSENKTLPLSSQIQRLSHYHDRSERNLLKPEIVYHFSLDNSFFIGKRIPKGSLLRFVVKVVNSPSWQKNYGSGKDISDETILDATPGTITLLMDKDHASAIRLPGSKVRK